MKSVSYGLLALLFLPVALLVGAESIKKLKKPARDQAEAPSPKVPKVKPPKVEAPDGPWETEEARKAANKAAKAFAKLDRDGDGLLSEEELPAKWREAALRFDR